jgi:hypothetical protein
MKRLITVIALCGLFSPALTHGECSDAANSGDESSRYARRALRESSLAEAQKYAKRAEDASKRAMEIAEECEYDEAANAFFNAARHAGMASKAGDLSAVKEYAREAMRVAEEGVKAAEQFR